MMVAPGERDDGQQGSILLPVILLLLLIATAATAMTLQARTSLREAATRRDRLAMATIADGTVRATALTLAAATAARSAPPFAIDGTTQGCPLDRTRRLWLTVQDEGGLVDLNKGSTDLIEQILRLEGLSAPDAGVLAGAITAHRTDAAHPKAAPSKQPGRARLGDATPPDAKDFVLANEIGDLPGVDTQLFTRLRPLFTTSNKSAGIDPAVASPALRALIPPKQLSAPQFESMKTPSNHSDFTITAVVIGPTGQIFGRRAMFRLDPDVGITGRFTAWDAPPLTNPGQAVASPFCERLATALASG